MRGVVILHCPSDTSPVEIFHDFHRRVPSYSELLRVETGVPVGQAVFAFATEDADFVGTGT